MRTLVLVLLLAGSATASAEGEGGTFPAWLTGGWSSQSADGGWSEEWWTPPKAGLMLGAGRSGTAGKVDWWEHTRIEQAGGKLRFCALPKGQAGACFDATRSTASEIVFENASHDFPNRVAYRRVGDELLAEISGNGGANVQRWRFKKIG